MPRYWYHMHSWIRGVALLIYGGQHHIEHYLPLKQGHPTTSDPSTILLREYQLVLKVPIGTAPSKIHVSSLGKLRTYWVGIFESEE